MPISRIKYVFFVVFYLLSLLFGISCNKLVQVPNPISSVTTAQTFSSDATATSAILGIYAYMSQNQSFSSYQTTFCAGESADELIDQTPGYESSDFFLSNTLTEWGVGGNSNVSGNLTNNFWSPAYYDIYCANAVISGVQGSGGITTSTANQLIGEAKFLRAFCYFYLTNLFGDIPLVLSTDFNQTVLLPKTPQAQIYQQIISDLLDAQTQMISDFSLTGGQPIRANRWAATALLARVYLYLPQPNNANYTSADSAASAVINSGQFSLVPLPLVPEFPPNVVDPDSDAFLANSKESILQLQTANTNPWATWEGNFFVPYSPTNSASAWLTSQLLGAFESNDLRRANWVDSTYFNGTYYYYPSKYKVMNGQGTITENYTLLRLAEQYLIRAEAEMNLGQLGPAIDDLNTIRARAQLDSLPSSLTQAQVLAAVQQEWRIEFFAEWGHRWLDLKRWGIAIQTLDTISYKVGNIDSTQLLYPIPMSDIQTDPNLKQNPGYN
jgi:hypothetical protein